MYGFVSMFSGASLFSTLQLLLYNILFTSVVVLLRMFDPSPHLSRLSFRVSLLLWALRALFQAVVVFVLAVLLSDEASELNCIASRAYLAVVWTVSTAKHSVLFCFVSCPFNKVSWTLVAESSAVTFLWLVAVPTPLLAVVTPFVLALLPVREQGMIFRSSDVAAAFLATLVALLPFFVYRAATASTNRPPPYIKLSDNEEL
jgi:magnesium-transporting ATPase (P-type)